MNEFHEHKILVNVLIRFYRHRKHIYIEDCGQFWANICITCK